MNRWPIGAGALLATLLAAAGCGSAHKAKPTASVSMAATLSAKATPLGRILVDGSGRTLYLFEKDKPGASSCTGACAKAWPPFISGGSASAGTGVSAARLSTVTRSDGTKQVAYNGHPLYRFSADAGAGSTKGQNVHAFGADWYVVSAAGEKVDRTAPSAAGSSGASSAPPY